jgi:hypothetical protein
MPPDENPVVARYNRVAFQLWREAEECDENACLIRGDAPTRCVALVNMQELLMIRREKAVRRLAAEFAALQRQDLAGHVEVTPDRLSAAYEVIINRILEDIIRLNDGPATQRQRSMTMGPSSSTRGPSSSTRGPSSSTRGPFSSARGFSSAIPPIVRSGHGRRKIDIPYKKGVFGGHAGAQCLNGIIAFLTRECRGNVHEHDVVHITASPALYGAPQNVADLEIDSCYFSNFRGADQDIPPVANNWICYDFCGITVMPTHYTIRSLYYGKRGGTNLKSWFLDGSIDGQCWEIFDRKDNTSKLDGKGIVKTFKIPRRLECRFLRLINIGRNHAGTDALCLSSFEIFGSILMPVRE